MQGHYEEGGWGWVVLLASFTQEVIIFGNIKALGVLAETISREFETDLWLTGWMISMSLAVQHLTAPLQLPLLHIFGYRPILLVAGAMATLGYLYAAVSRTFIDWSISIIAFAGTGSGCFCYVMISILAFYFKKYYPSAMLVLTIGLSLGTMVYGPVTQVLLDTYGWRWAMAIIAALTFHLVPCAAVAQVKSRSNSDEHNYRKIPQVAEDRNDVPESPETDGKNWCGKIKASLDLAIFTNVRFVLLTFASSVIAFCFVGWAVYVVPHGIHQGLTPTQSSFLTTSFGVGNIVGKIIASLLIQMNVLNERWIMCIGLLLTGGFFIVDPFLTSFAGLLLVTMALGLGNGVSIIAKIVIYRNMASDEKLLSIFSWQALFMGLSEILSGFATGWFFEVTGSFTATFIMLGFVEFLAVFALILDYVIDSYRKKP